MFNKWYEFVSIIQQVNEKYTFKVVYELQEVNAKLSKHFIHIIIVYSDKFCRDSKENCLKNKKENSVESMKKIKSGKSMSNHNSENYYKDDDNDNRINDNDMNWQLLKSKYNLNTGSYRVPLI